MAEKGLHLESIGLFFAKFVKGEPKKTRYRLAVSSNEDITQAEKAIYAQRGWEYITSCRHFNVFSSPEELNVPELYIDPIEQSYTLKKLNKQLVYSAFMSIFIIIAFIVFSYYNWFHNYTPILLLVGERSTIQPVSLTIFMMYLSYSSIKAAVHISTLRKNLQKGIHINHNAPWKKIQRLNYIDTVFYIVVFVITFIVPSGLIIETYPKTLPIYSEDLPIVRLADIEKDSSLVRQVSSYTDDDIDWGNWYKNGWSILAPIQYESHEEGLISSKVWEDGSGVYSPSINTWVYHLRYPSMSKGLVPDLIKRHDVESEATEKIEINHIELDSLIIYKSDGFKDVYASKGKGVINVRYFGDADTNSIIDSIVQKINLISD